MHFLHIITINTGDGYGLRGIEPDAFQFIEAECDIVTVQNAIKTLQHMRLVFARQNSETLKYVDLGLQDIVSDLQGRADELSELLGGEPDYYESEAVTGRV